MIANRATSTTCLRVLLVAASYMPRASTASFCAQSTPPDGKTTWLPWWRTMMASGHCSTLPTVVPQSRLPFSTVVSHMWKRWSLLLPCLHRQRRRQERGPHCFLNKIGVWMYLGRSAGRRWWLWIFPASGPMLPRDLRSLFLFPQHQPLKKPRQIFTGLTFTRPCQNASYKWDITTCR